MRKESRKMYFLLDPRLEHYLLVSTLCFCYGTAQSNYFAVALEVYLKD